MIYDSCTMTFYCFLFVDGVLMCEYRYFCKLFETIRTETIAKLVLDRPPHFSQNSVYFFN